MTPNIIPNAHSYRMTVAQRKEANELKRTLKPLMEKRRRARINESIDKLKALIVPLVGKETSRYSKLEKADILEMTVKYLKELPTSPVKAQADSYREGYEACMQRYSELLPSTSLDQETSSRVQKFIQQSMLSVPSCRDCSSTQSIVHPIQHEQALGQKTTFTTPTRMSIMIPTSDRAQDAAQITIQNVWRPW